MTQHAQQRVNPHVHQAPDVIHPEPILVLQEAVSRLHQWPPMVASHLAHRAMGTEPAVDPQHILATHLIRHVRDHHTLGQGPDPPAAVLAVPDQAPQPCTRPPQDPAGPLHEGRRVPLLVLVRWRQHVGQWEDPPQVHRRVELVA